MVSMFIYVWALRHVTFKAKVPTVDISQTKQ